MTDTARYSGRDPVSGQGRTLVVSDGVIRATEACDTPDLPILSPGLVDLQVNGFRGHDLNSGTLTPEIVEALSEALCQVGVAAYLPTLVTASADDLCQRLKAIREAQQTLPRAGRMIAGIHVEGPSISPEDGPRGAHPVEHIRPPSVPEFTAWQEAAGGLVRMITLAPEVDGADDYIAHVSRSGVCVALGHSAASEADIVRAVGAGARFSTHLGNGIANMMPRHPNAIWAQLSQDRLTASLILDGHHLPASTARAMIRAKGVERVVLVSDSVAFAGMPPGRYASPIGGEVDVSQTGRVSVAGTPYLAGSGMSLLENLCNYSAFTDLPFKDGLAMATRNPARLLGRPAALEPGEAASLILFDLDQATGRASAREIVFDGARVGP